MRHGFADERQLKTIMPKLKTFSRIYLVPFCSSKLVLSFKFSLPEISFAPIVNVEKHQIKEHGFLYLLIKQIVSLNELKMQRLINY